MYERVSEIGALLFGSCLYCILSLPLTTCFVVSLISLLDYGLFVSMPLATLMQTSLGLYRSPTGPGR